MARVKFHRTVASELTLWLSVITTIIAIVVGSMYYVIVARTVTSELLIESNRTADELSEVLVTPLFNFNSLAAQRIAQVFLRSGRVNGILIKAEGMGKVFDNLSAASSSLPIISRQIVRDGDTLGNVQLLFNDALIIQAKNRVVKTTVVAVVLILLLYFLSFSLLLRHILVKPLVSLGERLHGLVDDSFDGRLAPLPQEDLNTIVDAANTMVAEIARQTKTLRDNERNYREIYNATSDAIFIHTLDGTLLDVNQTMLDMYGYSREELLSLPLSGLKGESPYGYQEAAALLARAAVEGPQVFKWLSRKKDGSRFWVEVALKKAVLGDQQVVLAIVRDISQRERLEEQLRQSQRMEAIGTLAGGIAHDFNNILSAILGYTELSMMHVDDKLSKLFLNLQQVERASLRARELVRQILTFSRKDEPKKEVLNLEPVVSEAMRLLRSSMPVTVTIVQQFNAQNCVEVNASQIHQIIMNLCTNGYQAMVNAAGTLTVSLQDVEVTVTADKHFKDPEIIPGKYVVLAIRDDGAGMEPAIVDKIFEPYFTTRAEERGTGLGLSVVQGIVKEYNGYIRVSSTLGKGTVFQVYFPATDKKESGETQKNSRRRDIVGRRIMVADDEESVRHLMKDILVYAGYTVQVFADGLSAWNAMSADPQGWDLLITDLTMPGLTGAELARKARIMRPELPIILCTGYNEITKSCEQEDNIADICLQKPVTIQELLEAAEQVFQNQPTS